MDIGSFPSLRMNFEIILHAVLISASKLKNSHYLIQFSPVLKMKVKKYNVLYHVEHAPNVELVSNNCWRVDICSCIILKSTISLTFDTLNILMSIFRTVFTFWYKYNQMYLKFACYFVNPGIGIFSKHLWFSIIFNVLLIVLIIKISLNLLLCIGKRKIELNVEDNRAKPNYENDAIYILH
jgi:hypothetical protein